MRVLVCGSRDWIDIEPIRMMLLGLARANANDITIIEGNAKGADIIAGDLADIAEWNYEKYPANWDAWGKAAGPIRNREMLEKGKPDLVIAFHDDLGASKGTANMVRIAKEARVPVWVVRHG